MHRVLCGHFKHRNPKHSLTKTKKVCFQNRQAYDDWTYENREYARGLIRCPDCM